MDVCSNFCDSRLKPLEASFSDVDNFRMKVNGDVISGVVIDPTCLKVCVKFGDSRSNRSRDIRLSHFWTNHDHAGVRRSSHKGKTSPGGILPKNRQLQ